jgi:hypothetical protein
MTPTRILPDLQCSLVCEQVRQETSGSFILIGVINVIQVPQLPVVAPQLLIFNRWVAGIGQFNQTVRLIAPDMKTVLGQNSGKLALDGPGSIAINVTVLQNVKFETAGAYYLEVLVDDVMKLRYPLPVVVVPQKGQPGQQGQPPQPGEAPQAEG